MICDYVGSDAVLRRRRSLSVRLGFQLTVIQPRVEEQPSRHTVFKVERSETWTAAAAWPGERD